MSIASSDLVFYSSANIPTDDVSTSGGAVSTVARPELTQWAANNVAQIVSDGADTRTVTITGRLTTGVVDTEVLTANGTTPVTGAKTWERVMSAVASATSGTRTISIKEAAGGTVRATISVNETTRHICFQNASSDPSTPKTRVEKLFVVNKNGTLTLTSAALKLTADPSANIMIAAAASVNDSSSVANRLASTGLTFVDDNISVAVPGGGNLAASAGIGFWAQQSLLAAASPTKSSFTVTVSGNTV